MGKFFSNLFSKKPRADMSNFVIDKTKKELLEIKEGTVHAILPSNVQSMSRLAYLKCRGTLESVTFPASIISKQGFADIPDVCKKISRVEFCEGVTNLASTKFRFLSEEVDVILPKSLRMIDPIYMFTSNYEGSKLTINYRGTEEEWNKVSKLSIKEYKQSPPNAWLFTDLSDCLSNEEQLRKENMKIYFDGAKARWDIIDSAHKEIIIRRAKSSLRVSRGDAYRAIKDKPGEKPNFKTTVVIITTHDYTISENCTLNFNYTEK